MVKTHIISGRTGLLSLIFLWGLYGCQSTAQNSKIIATAFNMTTAVQQKIMDRYAPDDVIVQQNILYDSDRQLGLDLYQPPNIAQLETRPTVIWIHGGGWISGSREHARGYFKLLASKGYNVVSVQYQLAPKSQYPSQLQQINTALAYLQKHADQYNINPEQLYLAGDSAGANLASHYAALLTNPVFAQNSNFIPSIQPAQLKGLILHCGIYDLNAFVDTAPEEIKLVEWGVYNMVQAYTGDRRQDAAFLKQISPIQHITPNYPPVLISGGNKDFLTETQSYPFVQVLKANQVPVQEVFYPESKTWLIHEYQFYMGKKESQQTFERTLQFLQSPIGVSSTPNRR
ncbi:alpha/beta hydrolase [Acinetobacter sp. LoGeW2-3]|uniref:alpha/beta hydrolase n=1 Tax=Acinetobacter sp. LoGeW2-3 TaxID=1808001 RepID=UPI000C05A011|nr:alpha/beta hydrolase [Acinetobacter sp. LoGeW2-3]ATO20267.1 alpha/beta hydrolase [Acinetobacter sp. LoGeW2-3]